MHFPNKKYGWIVVIMLLATMLMTTHVVMKSASDRKFLSLLADSATLKNNIDIRYPFDHTVFPKDMGSPLISWTDSDCLSHFYQIMVVINNRIILAKVSSDTNSCRFSARKWEKIKKRTLAKENDLYVIEINNNDVKRITSFDRIKFSTSRSTVDAGIFYRAVPLPFRFARQNLSTISWHLGFISQKNTSRKVMGDMPVCANCHSFTPDGSTIGMDIDSRDDKGAYFIANLKKETRIRNKDIITWSSFQPGEATYGLLSQISPDGRYVISTLKDTEIFVDRSDFEYSQLFFPIKGILVFIDRKTGIMKPLSGADDTTLVQSNPSWSPDGKYIYFARGKALHAHQSGLRFGTVPSDTKMFYALVDSFFNGLKDFKFDIYRIPFNNSMGGIAEPVRGASENGMSNFFPKVSPNGKWLVYTRANNFMLLQPDSRLWIIPAEGGEAKPLVCNQTNMNSWHSWSPNSQWLVFSSKSRSPYTELFLTHIDEKGNASPPVLLDMLSFRDRALNIPEFVNLKNRNNFGIIRPDFYYNDVYYFNRLAKEKMGEENFTAAYNLYSHSIEINPQHYEAWLERGKLYFSVNNLEKALDDLNRAITIKNNCPGGHKYRGMVYLNMQQYESAFSDLNYATALDTLDAEAWFHLGLVKLRYLHDKSGCDDLLQAHRKGYSEAFGIMKQLCK